MAAKGLFPSVGFCLPSFNTSVKEKIERPRKRANGFCSRSVNKREPERMISAGSNVLRHGVTRRSDQFPCYSVCLLN